MEVCDTLLVEASSPLRGVSHRSFRGYSSGSDSSGLPSSSVFGVSLFDSCWVLACELELDLEDTSDGASVPGTNPVEFVKCFELASFADCSFACELVVQVR